MIGVSYTYFKKFNTHSHTWILLFSKYYHVITFFRSVSSEPYQLTREGKIRHLFDSVFHICK